MTTGNDDKDYGRDLDRYPPGWWIFPAVFVGALMWAAFFALIF